MAEQLSPESQFARQQMVDELASDQVFQAYQHSTEEIARVVAGLAHAAAMPTIEYEATPDDVAAVAELVAFSLGLDDYQVAGANAKAQYQQIHFAAAS